MPISRENISIVKKGGLCLQCGTCVSICPENCITVERDKMWNYVPVIDDQFCTNCGLCLGVCPGKEVDFKSLNSWSDLKDQRKYHRDVGGYLNAFLGYSVENEIRERASSGGVVPTILLHLLETGRIDGVLTIKSTAKNPFNPEVFIAKSRQGIFDSMQSKYHPVFLNSILKETDKSDGKYAIVGLPCHIHGLRKYERLKRELEEKIFFRIGLFCGLNLRFDSLEFFAHKVGEDLKDLERVLYREGSWPGKTVLQFTKGNRYILDKNIVNHIFTLPRCIFCIDHTNELADVSCGDAWLPELLDRNDEGWSAIISRSPRGQEILDELRMKNKLFMGEVNINKVIESQYPMLCFKKENSWLRLKLSKILGKSVPEYSTNSLIRRFKFSYLIGNTVLILVIYLMKYDRIKNFVKNVPIKILKLYESLILELLYNREELMGRIWKKIISKISEV